MVGRNRRKLGGNKELRIYTGWAGKKDRFAGLEVSYWLSPESLTEVENTVDTLVDRLLQMRDFTDNLQTLQGELRHRKTMTRAKQGK